MTVHFLQFFRNCRNLRIILKMLSLCLAPARASLPTACGLVLRKLPFGVILQQILLLDTEAVNGSDIIIRPTLR